MWSGCAAGMPPGAANHARMKGENPVLDILEDIISSLEKCVPIGEIRRGPLWTAVVSKRCGLASALNEGGCGAIGASADATAYMNMAADELAGFAVSDKIAEASLGLAAINSLIELDPGECDEMNASEFLFNAGRGKNVSVIGHFPFVDDLKKIAGNLWVIEKRPRPGDVTEEEGNACLPRSDLIAISSTTLINHTLASILRLCPENSIKVMLGPTTPMSKKLFDYGIDVISGSYVTDTELVLENIDRGLSFSAMKRSGGIRLLSLGRDRNIYRKALGGL